MATIRVLKGPPETTIYGARGANGVVVIMKDGAVLDTLLYGASSALDGVPTLAMSDRLVNVVAIMENYAEDYFIVTDETNTDHVLGIVQRTDVLEAYNKALVDAHIERHH